MAETTISSVPIMESAEGTVWKTIFSRIVAKTICVYIAIEPRPAVSRWSPMIIKNCAMKPKIPIMTNRASQSIRVEMTIGLFVAIIPTIDATMHINEKDVIECKACARFPMARSDI